jgi:signal transduction histidine kinase/putative methionine-R-sulfoxide reductase with GAF domain
VDAASTAADLERARREAELLNSITTAISGEEDLGRILSAALERLEWVVAFTGGSIALIEDSDLVISAAVGPFAATAQGQRLPRGTGRSWQVVSTRQPFLSNDLAADGIRATTPVRSYLAVPLIWRGDALGVLEVDSTESGAFRPADLALVERLAAILAGSIELARRYAAEARALAEARTSQERLAFLAKASHIVSMSLDAETTLDNVRQLAVPMLGDVCLVDLVDPERPAPPRISSIINSGHHELIPYLSDDDLASLVREEDRQAIGMPLPHSALVVPLWARGRALGALSLFITHSRREHTSVDLHLAQDLADRVGLAVDNARLFEQVQNAVHTRDEFLAAASHDLKNPLAVVKAQAQLLQRRLTRSSNSDPAQAMEGLSRIVSVAERAVSLVDDLLDVARLQLGGTLELERRPVDLVRLARDAVSAYQMAAERRRVSLQVDQDAIVGEWDERRLTRVMDNLLSNALKYSPEDSEVSVRVARQPDGETTAAVFAVRDRGIGIPAEDLPHLFERFRRGRNVPGSVAGSGVGLASARHIVQSHGGRITVTSREGEGSTFTVYLPLAPGGA